MKLPQDKSIKVRITMWYALFVILVFVLMMGVVIISQHISSKDFYYDRLAQAIDQATSSIQTMDDVKNLDMQTGTGVHISVLNEAGEILRGNNSFNVALNNKRIRVRMGANDDYWHIQDKKHILQDGNTVWLRCYVSSTVSERNISFLTVSMMIIVPFLIFIIIFGGFRLTKRAFRSLDRLIEIVESISDTSDLKLRFDVPEHQDEVAHLTDAFNKMLSRIERSVQNEKTFISDASHELRTPVSVIRAQSEFALRNNCSTEEKDKALEVILNRSLKAGEMLSQMLLLSRMDFQRLPIRFEEICISELLERLAQETESPASSKGIEIICTVEPDIRLYCDELLFMRAVTNLLDNAVRYGKEGGHIWISLKRINSGVELSVADDGIGISEENKDKVWKRFYQVKKSGNDSSGSGLGLAIVKWIIEAHGGTITLQSALGVGTEFNMQIPEKQKTV